MATYTTNYNLKKPDLDDFYAVGDFNGNADILDAAMHRMVHYANGSYVGASKLQSVSPVTFTLPFDPQVILITPDELDTSSQIYLPFPWIKGAPGLAALGGNSSTSYSEFCEVSVTSSGSSYTVTITGQYVSKSGKTYHWVALG